MKRYCLFLVVSYFFSNPNIEAQNSSYGAKGGMNFSSVKGEFSSNRTKFGFHGGGVAEISLLESLSIQSELLYSLQGDKDDSREGDGPLVETTLHYIQIPLLAKYYLFDNISAMSGPSFGFNVSAERKITPSGFGGNTEVRTENIREDIKVFDFGATIGLEYKFNFGLFLQARYVAGISDINDNSNERGKIRNKNFQLSTGFYF